MLRANSCMLWLAFATVQAQGATFTVNATNDLVDALPGDGHCGSSLGTCTLRAAVQEANLNASGTSLIVVPAGTYVLSIAPQGTNDAGTGDLNLAALPGTSIIIQGAGPGRTVVDANRIDSVFRVGANAVTILSGLTVRHGLNSFGGGVQSSGILTIIDCNIDSNSAQVGGGVYQEAVDSSSSLTLINTTVQHNDVGRGLGGGIDVANVVARIYNSTLNDNAAGSGGGLYNGGGTSFVVNSTIANNTADEDGGGIYNFLNTVLVYNSTITGNDADHDQNDVGGLGGGIANGSNSSARFVVVNSLLSDNTFRFVPVASNCGGTFELYGTNLSSSLDADCLTTNGHFALLTPSLIGPLRDNGGPTFTQALLPSSEAIDGTVNALGCIDEMGMPLTTDQRGASRPAGARCDVGAYEFGSVAPVIDLIFANGFD